MPFDSKPATQSKYQVTLDAALREVDSLKSRLERIDREKIEAENRIRLLDETIRALTPLCAEDELDANPRLMNFCQSVLEKGLLLTVPEIRKEIERMGFKMNYKNPLAVLHTTLNRLVASGQAQRIDGDDGKARFAEPKWKPGTANVPPATEKKK